MKHPSGVGRSAYLFLPFNQRMRPCRQAPPSEAELLDAATPFKSSAVQPVAEHYITCHRSQQTPDTSNATGPCSAAAQRPVRSAPCHGEPAHHPASAVA
jgi:hypothetical protein